MGAVEVGSTHSDIKKRWLRLSMDMLVLALPSLIVWGMTYPGYIQADHQNTIADIASGSPSEWHSLLWGYLAFPFIYMTRSFGVYGLVQIGIFTVAVMYSLCKMKELGFYGRKGYRIALLCFALCPTYVLYNLLYSSDVVFAILLLPLTVQIVEVMTTVGKSLERFSFCLGFGLLLYCEYELRKNAVLIAIVVITVLFCIYKKQRKRIGAIAACLLVLTGMSSFLFSHVLKAEPSPSQELMSVPVQQVARVYHDGGKISKEADKYFQSIHDKEVWVESYLPFDADPVKFNYAPGKKQVELSSDFIKFWAETGINNFGEYVSAYLDLMKPYWQITSTPSTQFIDTDFMDHDIYTRSTCQKMGNKCSDEYLNQFKGHYTYMRSVPSKLYNKIESMGIPVISDSFNLIFFDRALPLWLFVVGCIIAYRMRCLRKFVIMSLPLLCILISLLAFSPVAAFRYSLQMYYVLPLLAIWIYRQYKIGLHEYLLVSRPALLPKEANRTS